MISRGAGRVSRMRPISALAVAICVLAAAIGYGVARADHAVSALPQPVSTSSSGPNIADERLDHHVEDASSRTIHAALHMAVLHRTRPSTLSPSTQSAWWSTSLGLSPTKRYGLGTAGSCSAVTPLAGRERLTQLCVARH